MTSPKVGPRATVVVVVAAVVFVVCRVVVVASSRRPGGDWFELSRRRRRRLCRRVRNKGQSAPHAASRDLSVSLRIPNETGALLLLAWRLQRVS